MQLPGRLSASTLGDLLGALHRERTTGKLELCEIRGPRGWSVPGRRHRIVLAGGLIANVETELPVPPLGEILRRRGAVGPDALSLLLQRIQAGDPRAAGEILVTERLCGVDTVRDGLEKQLLQRLNALFGIEDARVAFGIARPLRSAAWEARPLSPDHFLHGRPRRRDHRRENGWPKSRVGEDTEPPRSGVRFGAPDDPRDDARRLLGLGHGADLAEVRRAFRKLAGELHPDRFEQAPASERLLHAARFARISEAYHLLVA